MVMQSLRDGAAGGFLKYILFGLLGMAVGGLVVMDVRGVFTGGSGISNTDVAKVGDKTIGIREFDQSVRRSLSRFNMPPEQAYKLGLIDEILTGEIRKEYMYVEAEKLGIEIGEKELAQKVAEIVKPQVQPGDTMQNTLNQLLRMQGMTERDFVSTVKKETASLLISNVVRQSFEPDLDTLAKELFEFQKQTRDIELITFKNSEVKDIEDPTEEQLSRLYESLKHTNFTIPEYRSARYVLIDPTKIDINVTVEEAEVKRAYKQNINKYKLGEQFVLTQALVDDEDTANKIYQEIENGKDLKTATVSVMGDDKKFYENTPFETDLMLPALSDALKDREIGKVVPPVKTMLGYHVVKISKILPPSTQSFDIVKYPIEKELTDAKKSDALFEMISSIEEKLIDGATLEDAIKGSAVENAAQISSLPLMDMTGLTADEKQATEQIDSQDSSQVVETIFELKKEEPSLVYELPSGFFIAFDSLNIQDEAFKPYEDVKDEIKTQFIADQQASDNKLRLEKMIAEIETGGSTFESIAKDNKKSITTIKDIGIQTELPSPLLDSIRPQIFKTAYKGYDLLELDGELALMHVIGANFPKLSDPITDEDKVTLEGIRAKISEEADDEAVLSFIRYIGDHTDTKVNQSLLDQVYGRNSQSN